MKIGLVAAKMKDNNIDYSIEQIENIAKDNCDLDLICFGESYLQGFEGLTWNFLEDKNIALTIQSNEINKIKDIAKTYNIAISFGFILNEDDLIYSANCVIDRFGNIVDIFKRVSTGWKEPIADGHYREGEDFHTFSLEGKTFATAICGDLWFDENLEKLKKLNFDVLLWPLYIDYTIKDWEDGELNEYNYRVKDLNARTLLINSFVDDMSRANGGCYEFYNGDIIKSLDMGEPGILKLDLD